MRVALLVLTVLLLGLADVAAARTSELRTVGPVKGPVAGDGERFVTYKTLEDETRVIDAVRKRTFAPVPAGCRTEAIGSGMLLYGCGERYSPPSVERIVNLRTGAVHEIAGLAEFHESERRRGGELPRFQAVGGHWLEASALYVNCQCVLTRFLNWRTGEVRLPAAGPYDRPVRVIPDLDLPRLQRRMCRPFRFSPYADTYRPLPNGWSQYDAPYGFALPRPSDQPLEIRRCGRSKPIVLSRRCRPCRLRLGGRFATWSASSPGRVVAYELGTATRWKWRHPDFNSATWESKAGRRVYMAPDPYNFSRTTLYVARLTR